MKSLVGESHFDAITALSDSGPAYIFYFCELMQENAEKLGLDKEPAKTLKEKVKSPNGTTEAVPKYFKSNDLPNTVYKAMEQAMERSKEKLGE